MKTRKIIIGILYRLIFILVLILGINYYFDSKVLLDREEPTVSAVVSGSNVVVYATDNVGVYAYTYSSKNELPNYWYEANNKKEFESSEHRLYYEFVDFIDMIDNKKLDKAREMLEISGIASELMEKARLQEGIYFKDER